MDKYEPITVSPEYQEALDREAELHGFAWNGTLHVDREGKCPLDQPTWLRRLQAKDLTGQVTS